ncbi:MAG: tetratricopeptide repeat protein [Nitrospira sp.]|nr:tetratricopeptide repeat protein [Nitrospira sp.]
MASQKPSARMYLVAAWMVGFFVGLLPYSIPSTVFAQIGKPDGLYYKSWAIVIGIDDYTVAPPIQGAVDDAKQVAQAFRKLGFDEVVEIYGKDASHRRLRQIFNDILPRKVGRMDRLVIFYTGHVGVTQDAEGEDRSYLVPRDAQINNPAKAVTVEYLKEFTRRSASKHTLLLFDAPVFGWEITVPEALSLEGRIVPEAEIDRRAVQVISSAQKGESSTRVGGTSLFVQALVAGLDGAADADTNGWLMASELGAYLGRAVETASNGIQHPTSLRIGGDGDMALLEGQTAPGLSGADPHSPEERRRVARSHYEQAVTLLQEGKPAAEAMEHLSAAILHDATYGDAYVLKGYLHLDTIPDLDEAVAAGRLAVKYAPTNADSFYTLGLIEARRGNVAEAETALQQALKVNPDYQDVYFSLGVLYADHVKDQPKSVDAFRRYLELGGVHARAQAVVSEADRAAKESH